MSRYAPRLTVRVGCHLLYEATAPTPIIFVLRPRRDKRQWVTHEIFSITSATIAPEYKDSHGNITQCAVLQPGENVVHHDALVSVTSLADDQHQLQHALPIHSIPSDIIRYTLPSRYCDSDKLLNFAWQQFGPMTNGLQRVREICDWTHYNIEYRFGSGRPDISASEIIARRFGVCRDFAHVAVALCRTFNLPARYVTGHLPDIGYLDPGTPMDFHAYFEVYLDGGWCTFDARYNVPRIGRVKVAQGLDAVDGAFSTIYGQAQLSYFEVWAYQVHPGQVAVGDPVDLSKRLDGTPQVRLR